MAARKKSSLWFVRIWKILGNEAENCYIPKKEVLMTTLTITFDALDYFSRLKEAGVPEEQAHVIADGLQKSLEIQNAAFENACKKWEEQDETKRQELATKQDLALEIEKVRLGIEALRNETTNKISDTMVKIEQAKSSLIKWQIGIAITALSIMAGGLGGLVYIMAEPSNGPVSNPNCFCPSSEGLFFKELHTEEDNLLPQKATVGSHIA